MLLVGNLFEPFAKRVLIPLELTTAASATDAAIYKNNCGSGDMTLIISNEEINGIIKIVKTYEESGLFIKVIGETIKNEAKEQKGGFLGMLLATVGASLLGNLLKGKDTIRAREGTIRAGQDF